MYFVFNLCVKSINIENWLKYNINTNYENQCAPRKKYNIKKYYYTIKTGFQWLIMFCHFHVYNMSVYFFI